MDENIIIASAGSELNNAVQVIKDAILQSQQRALKAINQEQLALYYGIGRYISVNTRKKNWGSGFIASISEQLRKELPGLKGFSARNLRNMRTFYEEWRQLEQPNSPDGTGNEPSNLADETAKLPSSNLADGTAKLQNADSIQALQITQLPDFPLVAFLSVGFSHHTTILSLAKTYEERIFYMQFAADYKVKVEDLEKLI